MTDEPGTQSYDPEDRLHEAIAEFEEARDRGLEPDPQEWLSRYPDVAEELEDFLNSQDWLKKLATPLLGPLTPDQSAMPETTAPHVPFATATCTGPDWLSRIPDLKILAELDSGGMGNVYKVYQLSLDRTVVLKTVRPELLTEEGLQLFRREAKLLARLKHPSIVQIHEFHPNTAIPYFFMEYVDGVRLDQAVDGRSWKERASLFAEILAAVASAHGRDVVHGDLKPANVLVDRECRPHILDFGLGRLARGDPTSKAGDAGGTLAYLAPEVVLGRAPPSVLSDIYALGVTLYVALTGLLPSRSAEQLLAQSLGEEVRLPMEHDPGVPEVLQRICLKAMERDPNDRYQTAEQMRRDLQRYCEGQPVFARPRIYERKLEGRARNHLTDIGLWEKEGFISRRERDTLVKPYSRILGLELPWLSETRKVLGGPVLFRVGAWFILISAVLWPAFYWHRLGTTARLASSGLPAILMAGLGGWFLHTRNRKNALACLGSFALLFLIFFVVLLSEFHWLEFLQRPDWEIWGKRMTHASKGRVPQGSGPFFEEFVLSNSQIFAALAVFSLCIGLLLRLLKAVFFASWLAVAFIGLFTSVLLLVGDKELLLNEKVAWVAVHYVLISAVIFLLGMFLEWCAPAPVAARFYLVAAGLFILAEVALARFGTEEWFKQTWKYDNEVWNIWIMPYSLVFLLFGWLSEHGTEAQRHLARVFYLLVPIFLLVPLNMLFDKGPIILAIRPETQNPASSYILAQNPVRIYELVYLAACIALLILGRGLHMELFLVAGLAGFAVLLFRATEAHFSNDLIWPLAIIVTGLALVVIGIRLSPRRELALPSSPAGRGVAAVVVHNTTPGRITAVLTDASEQPKRVRVEAGKKVRTDVQPGKVRFEIPGLQQAQRQRLRAGSVFVITVLGPSQYTTALA
jgi:hypothetical protein